jgi:methanol:N,N-dimethyl-4-nitrosoaniline oxidoreductase
MMNMTWAEYTAGQAFSSGFLGILHSLSHAVCAYYDIHHGLTNGVGMARVWAYNQPAATHKFADIARAMGINTTGLTDVEAGDRAIEAVIRLAKDVNIPENFSSVQPYPKSRMGLGWYSKRPKEIKSDEEELRKMAQHMMDDLCTAGNARTLTLGDAREMMRDCVYDPMSRRPKVVGFQAGRQVDQGLVSGAVAAGG